jgi:Ser/Thr protein kinase RdoA (MazF antagonist)
VPAPPSVDEARSVLAAWDLEGARVEAILTGHINGTFRVVDDGGHTSVVLQSLAPIFAPEVNEDIAQVTAHLASRGVETPRIVPCATGRCGHEAHGRVWRVLTWVEGRTHTTVSSPDMAFEAGRALGRFHRGLADYRAPFRARRLGVHDTPAHLAGLRNALAQHPNHALFPAVEPSARAILELAGDLPPLPQTPDRVVHGDPKISNLIFHPEPPLRARAWVDLDTVGRMRLPLELGDAFRSWCNQADEDQLADFELSLFEGAVRGYAEAAPADLRPEERDAIVDATAWISLELAARFCRDALEETYFGWDDTRFDRPGSHHLSRTRGQLALHRAIRAQAGGARRTVAEAFRGR